MLLVLSKYLENNEFENIPLYFKDRQNFKQWSLHPRSRNHLYFLVTGLWFSVTGMKK